MGFKVWDSKYEIQSMGFKVWDSKYGIQSMGFKVWDSKYGIQSMGFKVCIINNLRNYSQNLPIISQI